MISVTQCWMGEEAEMCLEVWEDEYDQITHEYEILKGLIKKHYFKTPSSYKGSKMHKILRKCTYNKTYAKSSH